MLYSDSWNLYKPSISHFSFSPPQHWRAILDTGKVRLHLSPKAYLLHHLLLCSALERIIFVYVLLKDAMGQYSNSVQLLQGLPWVCLCETKWKHLHFSSSILSLFLFKNSITLYLSSFVSWAPTNIFFFQNPLDQGWLQSALQSYFSRTSFLSYTFFRYPGR